MGVKHLWDTNTVIHYLQQQFPPPAEKFIDDLLIHEQPCISAISEIELLSWRTGTQKDLDVLNNFIQDALVIELEQPIKLKTAEIRKQHKVKLPDAIIAATALLYNLTLITRNVRDFQHISDLSCINPWEK